MKKRDIIKALEALSDDQEVLVEFNGVCGHALSVEPAFQNPDEMCSRGAIGDSEDDRLSFKRTDWEPVIVIRGGW